MCGQVLGSFTLTRTVYIFDWTRSFVNASAFWMASKSHTFLVLFSIYTFAVPTIQPPIYRRCPIRCTALWTTLQKWSTETSHVVECCQLFAIGCDKQPSGWYTNNCVRINGTGKHSALYIAYPNWRINLYAYSQCLWSKICINCLKNIDNYYYV